MEKKSVKHNAVKSTGDTVDVLNCCGHCTHREKEDKKIQTQRINTKIFLCLWVNKIWVKEQFQTQKDFNKIEDNSLIYCI